MAGNRAQASTALKRLMAEVSLTRGRSGPYLTLPHQFRQMQRTGSKEEDMFVAGPISEGNFFEWEAFIRGPDDTPFEGGVFIARLSFPRDYPLNPPKMRFDPPLMHPNIYADGNVCISILHSPGDDPNMYESSSERWSPVQNVQSILLSVVSMLAEPNIESGANIDVCKLYRDDRALYEKTIRNFVRQQLGVAAEP